MIGHNNGPPIGDIADTGGRARLYYWKKAHRAAWRTPPIEIVRLRDRAAQRVGITYKDYTSILLDRGRRVSAVFFQLEGTLLRMRNGGPVPDGKGAFALMPGALQKLRELDCAVFILARARAQLPLVVIDQCVSQLRGVCHSTIDHAVAATAEGVPDLARSIRDVLERHQLPPSQALLVGDTLEAERAAATTGLARFLWAWHYFGDSLM